jgi:hypothetical protein
MKLKTLVKWIFLAAIAVLSIIGMADDQGINVFHLRWR